MCKAPSIVYIFTSNPKKGGFIHLNSNQDLLDMVLTQLKGDFSTSSVSAWLDDAQLVSIEGNEFVLCARNEFKKNVIVNRFVTPMQEILTDLMGAPITMRVIYEGEQSLTVEPALSVGLSTDEEYTFEHFIVGSSNKFAHAAAVSVSKQPAVNYNPLFIYGQSGLGKTHLLYAIGNTLRKTQSRFRIIYVKGEDFTNELITAIQDGNVVPFRNKYRMADLLLIDDIQFIAGKDRTQEEFFHTFNALYEAGKQIVLTSDRPPKEMNTLEDRMKTRFEWGLLADIQPPDFETRVAIVNAKAEKMQFEIPREIVYCICENLQSNIRQLEGTVKKIKAKHELANEPITTEMTLQVIEEVRSIQPGLNPTPSMIIQTVSNFYSLPVDQIMSDRRSKDTVLPRQMAMYLVRKLTNNSLPEIGKVFSRDHTTVMHACDKIDNDRKKNAELEDIIKTLIENIQNI